jgi:hypothetical protein
MEKVLRKETTQVAVGWTDTNDKKGTRNEFVDGAGYTTIAVVSETMRSLDHGERAYIKQLGEWK